METIQTLTEDAIKHLKNVNKWDTELFKVFDDMEIAQPSTTAATPKPPMTKYQLCELEINNIPKKLYKAKSLTGSYLITNGTKYNDIDYIIYTTTPEDLEAFLLKLQYTICGKINHYPESIWKAYRFEDLNLIVTDNYYYYIKWLAATQLAKVQVLMDKKDRIKLFDIVLNDLPKTNNVDEIPF